MLCLFILLYILLLYICLLHIHPSSRLFLLPHILLLFLYNLLLCRLFLLLSTAPVAAETNKIAKTLTST
jgi:hypothetical protein